MVVAALSASGIIKVVDEKLIAIWCAAVISVPRVPIKIEIAEKSPASAVIVTAIGSPREIISLNADKRNGASLEKIWKGR